MRYTWIPVIGTQLARLQAENESIHQDYMQFFETFDRAWKSVHGKTEKLKKYDAEYVAWMMLKASLALWREYAENNGFKKIVSFLNAINKTIENTDTELTRQLEKAHNDLLKANDELEALYN